eukprot:c2217_g1_i1.p1 GENE.c2217_g1_i1~~c2217_g1_i1.p1  ORF type:complete len:570 (-),score=197.19 c2217_g1_i1:18-1631(-)
MSTLAHTQNEVKELKLKLEGANAAKEQLTQQLVRMAEDVARAEKVKEEQVSKVTTEKKQLLEERVTLSTKAANLDSSREEVQQLRMATRHLEAQLRTVEQERTTLGNTLKEIGEQLQQTLIYNRVVSDELLKEAEEIREGKAALIARMAQLELNVETAESHSSLLKDELMEVENKNMELKRFFGEQFVQLQQEIATVKTETTNAMQEAQQAKESVFEQVQVQLTASRENTGEIESQLAKERADKEQLVDLVKQLQDKLRSVKAEAETKQVSLNLDEVERLIADAETGVAAIEKKLNEDVEVDPTVQMSKKKLREEYDALVGRLVMTEDKSERARLETRLKETQALLGAMSSDDRHKYFLDVDPRKLMEFEEAVALLKLQQKVFQIIKIMALMSSSPLQKAFLKWRAFVSISEAESMQGTLGKREQQLRREKTKIHSKMLQTEHETEQLQAEIADLRKQLKDATQATPLLEAEIKKLKDELAVQGTQNLRKMEDTLAHLEEEKDKLEAEKERLVEENVKLNATITRLRSDLQNQQYNA